MVRVTMQYHGHRVIEAGDGEEAWRLVAAERPDLVVLDVVMPGLGGLDVCRAIRADASLVAVPVVILTAGGLESDEAEARAAGASAFMTKPFSPTALLALVASLCGA